MKGLPGGKWPGQPPGLVLVARVGRLLAAEGKQEEGEGEEALQHEKAFCVTCTAANSAESAASHNFLLTGCPCTSHIFLQK